VDYSTHRIEALNLSHADNVEQAKALLTLAQALFDGKKYPDAEVRLRRVMELSKDELPLRLDALVLMTRLQLAMQHLKESQAAQQELEAQVNLGVASPIVKAWSVFLKASILERQNHFEQTLPMYQQAIDQALIAEGPLSRAAISMRLAAEYRILQHGNIKLAKEYFDQADKALRQLGTVHEVRATLASAQFAFSLWVNGGITILEATDRISGNRARLAASELPIPDWYLSECDELLALIKLYSGDVTSGLPMFELSQASMRKTLGPDNDRRQTSMDLGMAMKMAGRHEIADQLLREALELTNAAGLGAHPYSAGEYYQITSNLRMWGKYLEAEQFLNAAPKFEHLRGEGPSADGWNKILIWERAALQLEMGNTKVALQVLKANPPEPANQDDSYGYDQALGEALCLDRQTNEGFVLLKKTESELGKSNTYPYSPDYGRVWGDLGLCTLAAGDRTAAQNYAAKARKVFAIQPGVSPYYKKPLQKLEHQLGMRSTDSKG
jgi:tetratricopeptide (TPR) repeat protein